MDSIRLLIDFGSTYTKVVAVDIDREEIVAATRVPSTVETDITVGLNAALAEIAGQTGITDLEKKEALACSSAAGGLRIICAGFVPDLTSRAANQAALGAGAKVVGCYSYKLNRQEVEEIAAAAPDILLLSGGTDGGDEEVILHNAGMCARAGESINNIIIAGNKTAHDKIKDIFNGAGKHVIYTGNVMPEIGVLEVGPCNREIRDLFMKNIIEAKGIAAARAVIKDVIMPTPSAVLEAARIIAEGCGGPGFGELIVIDVGGATTDVHSIARGEPEKSSTYVAGLPEPYLKRTVEGDLGLRHNLDTLRELLRHEKLPQGYDEIIARFHEGKLAETDEEFACLELLAGLTVDVAMRRHAGRIEVVYGTSGETLVQHGKDLTRVGTIIGTGGPVIHSRRPGETLRRALYRQDDPASLKPKKPKFYLDGQYILYAVGLLAQVAPEKAFNIAAKYLQQV